MKWSACFSARLAVVATLFVVSGVLVIPGEAATLYWTGNVGTNWFGVDGVNTNWRNAANEQVVPTDGDDLVFTSAGAYTGNLTLGGATITLNSITVGDPNNRSPGGPSDFGVDLRVLATNGTIRLSGAGGLNVEFPDGATANNSLLANFNTRNYRFDTDFEFVANSRLRGSVHTTNHWFDRRIYFGGEISGGSAANPITLEISTSNGSQGTTKAMFFEQSMPNLFGTLKISGTTSFPGASDIWGDPSTTIELSVGGTTNVYAHSTAGGTVVTPNNLVFAANRAVLLSASAGGVWELSGDISGGASTQQLDLLGGANSVYDFSGEHQTFSNRVDVRTGVTAVISGAGPDGIAWPNVNYIRLNWSRLTSGTSGLLLRGDFELKKRIEIPKLVWTTFTTPVRIGQLNDGATPFDAVFGDTIRVLEDGFQVLRLTADAGGSAMFNEKISVAGGVYGFDKVGAGTVAVNHRVSQAFTNTLPIGLVNVEQGTLLVNSPAAGADSFYTTGIVVKEGATLGGTGQIVGDVTLAGTTVATLAPGNSIGTLSVDGDVVFGSFGRFLVEVGDGASDRLDVTGLLDLTGSNDVLEFETVGSLGAIYVIADYGTLAGQFDTVVGLPEGYWLDYAYLGVSQIALVPEPSTAILLALGLMALLARRRCRKVSDLAVAA